MADCSATGCNQKVECRGLCEAHYTRFRRHGTVLRRGTTKLRKSNNAHLYPMEYGSWASMKSRCINIDNPSYKNYGAKGVKVCQRWTGDEGFQHFIKDMGLRPKGCSLDRINPYGDYELSNCRWATRTMQNRNKRSEATSLSGRKGVTYNKQLKKWRVHIKVNGKRLWIGSYQDVEDAINTRVKAEYYYWGIVPNVY